MASTDVTSSPITPSITGAGYYGQPYQKIQISSDTCLDESALARTKILDVTIHKATNGFVCACRGELYIFTELVEMSEIMTSIMVANKLMGI